MRASAAVTDGEQEFAIVCGKLDSVFRLEIRDAFGFEGLIESVVVSPTTRATFGTENAFARVERREFANERLNGVFDAWYWINLWRITEGFYDTALNEASDA